MLLCDTALTHDYHYYLLLYDTEIMLINELL